MENEQVTPESQKIAIELMKPEDLKDASIAEVEGLLTLMHGYMNTLHEKQQMVHDVLEAKQRAAVHDAKTSGMSDTDIEALEESIKRRKAKPPTQSLIGDHITKDADQVNPGT